MTRKQVEEAIAESEKFVARAKDLLDDVLSYADCMCIPGSAKSAAMKRSSLEVTRALARMRGASQDVSNR